MRRRRPLLLGLLVAAGLAGCQGVPVDDDRYRVGQEPLEAGLGLLAFPVSVAFDLVLLPFDPTSPFPRTTYAATLLNPLCNAVQAAEAEAGEGDGADAEGAPGPEPRPASG